MSFECEIRAEIGDPVETRRVSRLIQSPPFPFPAASEQGEKTPLSPIHNSATSESTVHISGSGETTKIAGKAAEVESVEPALHVVEKKAHEAEEEQAAGQQSAYNEETGEINWDCPVSAVLPQITQHYIYWLCNPQS